MVCAYTMERWDAIRAALGSLRQQTRPPEQIILVSDHNPELLDRARQEFPDVECLANTETRGLSGARNTGVRSAVGDVVAFLDDDAAAEPAWAERLLSVYRDPTVVGMGGGVDPDWQAPRPSWFPDEFLWVVGCSYTGQPQGMADVRNPIGANMSFRRSVFQQTGGFDANMGRLAGDAAGCEETEFSIRARRVSGGRILLAPSARCRHSVTPERVTQRYFRRRCRAEGRSKAMVGRLVGSEDALSSERRYVTRTLPLGVLRGVADLVRGDVTGLLRAVVIVEGTALTAAAYAWKLWRLSRSG